MKGDPGNAGAAHLGNFQLFFHFSGKRAGTLAKIMRIGDNGLNCVCTKIRYLS
jgi:hypothetical protein